MFDRYVIVEGSLRNVEREGRTVGFAFEARYGYYRRLILSMVEDLAVTVDGERYPRESIEFTLRGRRYTLDEMETEYHEAWEFGELATVTVLAPEGLPEGGHEIALRDQLGISYMPRPTIAETERTEHVDSLA